MRGILLLLLITLAFPTLASVEDSTATKKLVTFFKQGHFYGQIRDFTMSTINQGQLRDYYANAIGASIHYETKPWKGFKVGINGLFIYRGFSNDLLAKDSLVGKYSSYEQQLFDLEYPGNYTDLDRLEELYIDYTYHHWNATFGKMEVETPIVNMHDGRMKPKVFMGTKAEYSTKRFDAFGGWFWKASPRSITHWYSMSETIGLFSNGVLPDGTHAEYHNHISTKGLAIAGAEIHLPKHFEFNLWNYYLENVSNTFFVNPFYDDSTFYAGMMYLNQFADRHGGHELLERTYFDPSMRTHALSGRLGYTMKAHTLQFSASHVFEGGKFIFPREIGVDPFYTFISRSQIEGFGHATAMTLSYIYERKNWSLGLHWNHMKSIQDYAHNKYNIPAYNQYNVDLKYAFKKKLEGLEFRLLYVYRQALDTTISYAQTFNKVNFHQFNLVVNFNF